MTTLEDIPADRGVVERLYRTGAIDREGRLAALDLILPAAQWRLWASRALLALGAALVLAGIVIFFAYNWADIKPFAKFGLISGGIVAALIAAWILTLERFVGQLCLVAASVLVGALLAVIGQVYQTGADAYQLFLLWALLIAGWTAISRFAPHWVVWLVVLNLSHLAWWYQSGPLSDDVEKIVLICVGLVNAVTLFFRELAVRRVGAQWLAASWTRLGLVTIIVAVISFLIFVALDRTFVRTDAPLVGASIVVNIALLGAGYWLYRYKIVDLGALSLVIFGIGFAVWSVMFHQMNGFKLNPGVLSILAAATLGIAGAVIAHIRALYQADSPRDV